MGRRKRFTQSAKGKVSDDDRQLPKCHGCFETNMTRKNKRCVVVPACRVSIISMNNYVLIFDQKKSRSKGRGYTYEKKLNAVKEQVIYY